MLPRVLAPLLVLSVVSALSSRVALFVQRSRGGMLGTLHTDSAVSSAILLGAHLLTYLPDALTAIARERRARGSRPAIIRMAGVILALTMGGILAIATYNSGVWPARPHDQRERGGIAPSALRALIAVAAEEERLRDTLKV